MQCRKEQLMNLHKYVAVSHCFVILSMKYFKRAYTRRVSRCHKAVVTKE